MKNEKQKPIESRKTKKERKKHNFWTLWMSTQSSVSIHVTETSEKRWRNDENKEEFVYNEWTKPKKKHIEYKNNEPNAKSNEFKLIEYTGEAISFQSHIRVDHRTMMMFRIEQLQSEASHAY